MFCRVMLHWRARERVPGAQLPCCVSRMTLIDSDGCTFHECVGSGLGDDGISNEIHGHTQKLRRNKNALRAGLLKRDGICVRCASSRDDSSGLLADKSPSLSAKTTFFTAWGDACSVSPARRLANKSPQR
jgi:hypothetical protein